MDKEIAAFPHQNHYGHKITGMTLRDYFAARAMQADVSTYTEDLMYETPEWFEARAEKWYEIADAMLKARQV